jgi:hypothetical protein
MSMKRWLAGVLVVLFGLLSVDATAQGPFSAQIVAALQVFVRQPHTWTATQTFTNITINGSCTGCGAGAPTVTNHAVYVGTGTTAATSIGPGATNTVLHGLTGADPAYSAVVEADLSLTDVTTNNASSTKHGFLAKLSGNAYDFFLGDGTFGRTIARGTITTSSPWTFSQTWNAGAVTFTGLDINNTVTAAADGSAYFKIENAGGEAFSIVKDTTFVATNGVAISVNAQASASSSNFAFRGTGGFIYFTAGPATNALRQAKMSTISLGSVYDTTADARLWRTTGLNLASTLPACWTASNADAACDTGLNRTSAGVLEVNNGTPGTLAAFKGAYQVVTLKDSNTAPTIASGGCTSPAITHSNGTAAFLITIGTSCTGVKTITLTLPAASHFWACDANNNTNSTQQNANVLASLATSTTAVVLTNYARTTGVSADFTASDTLLVKCSGE